MSLVKISGNASGTGTFEIAAPNSNTNRTLTLPDASGTVVVGASAVSAAGQIPFSTDGTSYTPTEKIVSGTVVASTSGASIDFTSIPSWVKRITVMLVTNKRFICRKREMGIFSRLIQYRSSKRNSGSLLRATLTLRPSKGCSGLTPHFAVARSGA